MEVAFFLVRTYIIGVEPQLELKTEFKNGFFRFFLFVCFVWALPEYEKARFGFCSCDDDILGGYLHIPISLLLPEVTSCVKDV